MKKNLINILSTIIIGITQTGLYTNTFDIAEGEVINKNLSLVIPKISLTKELYPEDKINNTVDKNIQVIETSVMPNVKHGNLILAAHSGNSKVGYFKHLDQLKINDEIYVYYKGIKYPYILKSIYDQEKTGYIKIKRDRNKQTLTLITCKKNTNKQTVYISYQTP